MNITSHLGGRQILAAALVTSACLGAAGCGGDPPAGAGDAGLGAKRAQPAKIEPDVASRVIAGDSFLGMPALEGFGGQVRTSPGAFSGDYPDFYPDPPAAIADLRRLGFVAGIHRLFKTGRKPATASHSVVQMRDADGAAAELARQVGAAEAPDCPGGLQCRIRTARFPVPGAVGVQTRVSVLDQPTDEHPDVLYNQTIVFTGGAFVQQVFSSADRPGRHRAKLIAAAKDLAVPR